MARSWEIFSGRDQFGWNQFEFDLDAGAVCIIDHADGSEPQQDRRGDLAADHQAEEADAFGFVLQFVVPARTDDETVQPVADDV